MGLKITLPDIDKQVDALRVVPLRVPAGIDEERVALGGLSESIRLQRLRSPLGLDRAPIQAVGPRLVLRDDAQELEIFRASGSVRWRRLRRTTSELDGAGKLPSREQATKLADEYLHSLSLTDDYATVDSVDATGVTRMRDGKVDAEAIPVEVHVNYRFVVQGFPVVGSGAKMQVTFGSSNGYDAPHGEADVVGMFKFWRAPVESSDHEGPRGVITYPKVAAALETCEAFRGLSPKYARIEVKRVFLGYFAAPPREVQRRLLPVYVCDGVVRTPSLPEGYPFSQYVLAVELAATERERIEAAVRDLIIVGR